MKFGIAGLTICREKEGLVERTGKKGDKTAEKVGRQTEKAGDKIQDGARGAGKK